MVALNPSSVSNGGNGYGTARPSSDQNPTSSFTHCNPYRAHSSAVKASNGPRSHGRSEARLSAVWCSARGSSGGSSEKSASHEGA